MKKFFIISILSFTIFSCSIDNTKQNEKTIHTKKINIEKPNLPINTEVGEE